MEPHNSVVQMIVSWHTWIVVVVTNDCLCGSPQVSGHVCRETITELWASFVLQMIVSWHAWIVCFVPRRCLARCLGVYVRKSRAHIQTAAGAKFFCHHSEQNQFRSPKNRHVPPRGRKIQNTDLNPSILELYSTCNHTISMVSTLQQSGSQFWMQKFSANLRRSRM